MAIQTTQQQLEEVQAAISKCLKAQEKGIGDKRLQRARLDELTQRETLLLARYKSEQGKGGPVINQAIPRRRY